MSTLFISDLHFGHENILEFAKGYREGETIAEHDEWLIAKWNAKITKRDLVFVLGDVAMDFSYIKTMDRLRGRKKLILGNHDSPNMSLYLPHFEEIYGFIRYKEFWLSHCPIHPQEFRKKKYNIHGHLHQKRVMTGLWPDPTFINVCVEIVQGTPIALEEIRESL